MKLPLTSGLNRRGFTLLEVIVTIIAAGILAAFFVQFMGTAMSRASASMERVQAESGGEATVERITADFVAAMNSDPTNAFDTLTTNIDNGIYDDTPNGIDVTYIYVSFDGAGILVDETPDITTTLQITVELDSGNDMVFLLGESRTAADQPLVRF